MMGRNRKEMGQRKKNCSLFVVPNRSQNHHRIVKSYVVEVEFCCVVWMSQCIYCCSQVQKICLWTEVNLSSMFFLISLYCVKKNKFFENIFTEWNAGMYGVYLKMENTNKTQTPKLTSPEPQRFQFLTKTTHY